MCVERQISIISFMRKKNLIKLNNIIVINYKICKLAHLRITNWFYVKTLESKSQFNLAKTLDIDIFRALIIMM